MWTSIKLEPEIGGILGKESYSPFWWKWAGKLLSEDPAIIPEEVGSVALAIHHHFHQRKLETERSSEQMALRRRQAVSQPNGHVREHWDGETINMRSGGRFPVFIRDEQPALQLQMTTLVVSKIQYHGGVAVFDFPKDGLAIKVGGRTIHERSREGLLTVKDGSRWVEQFDTESLRKKQRNP